MLDHVLPKLQHLQQNHAVFQGIKRGIERETLRVNRDAQLASPAHPKRLGSKLTHPHITTDYSENLLELITSPSTRIEELFGQLHDIHAYTLSCLPEQYFWPFSMPCQLGSNDEIPIANYGTSNSGKMKMHYRRGLGHRYGRHMQTIAGLHFNFSLPKSFWQLWFAEIDPQFADVRQCSDHYYMALIRNCLRYAWLIYYLFGASPAVHSSFFTHNQPTFLELYRNDFYTAPEAVALRMSEIGYQSLVQDNTHISYNSLQEYTDDLKKATETSLHSYEQITERYGPQAQLNSNILQIEAELYSAIRPKQPCCPGQRPVFTLQAKGIEYIEVRGIDINPFEPVGISQAQVKFLDVFLLYCLLADSPKFSAQGQKQAHENQVTAVLQGRDPYCMLQRDNTEISLRDWAQELIGGMARIAALLDQEYPEQNYQDCIQSFAKQFVEPGTIMSARYMDELKDMDSYLEYGKSLAKKHHEYFAKHGLNKDKQKAFETMAKESLQKQQQMEESDNLSYEEYVRRYYEEFC